MIQAKRFSHAAFETPDLERQIDYYTNVFGLTLAEREKGRAFLATRIGQQVVVLEQGAEAQCKKVAFEVAPDVDLSALAKTLGAQGIRVARKSGDTPAVSDVLSFTDPKGTEIEVFTEAKRLPLDPRPAGFSVLKLGHLAFNVVDIQKVVAFYQDVMGFRISDWRADIFAFMRCGPDHHTVNFAAHGTRDRMHHVAFEVKDWAEIQRACDFLGRHNYHLVWGPGRHIIGHNVFIYHLNPDRQVMELYCELDQIKDETQGAFDAKPWHQDFPQKPKVWPLDTLGSYWGGRAPQGFGDY